MPAMDERFRRTAVVTGASSGIGAATARALAAADFTVVCAARRIDRLRLLADEIGATAVECDVTSAESVSALAEAAGSPVHVLVNNAGGAFGQDAVADSDPDDWRRMFEVNVIGTLQVFQALLPALRTSGDAVVVNVGSTAGHASYEGGAGYTAAKHAVKTMTETMRLEHVAEPIRFTEIAPGMVRTDEFALTRYGGDAERAAAVYAGVARPLTAEDIADAITWVATRPSHVDVDLMVLRPRAQAAQHKVHRQP
jgi:NADP-dependent 3-hydroxy acid dehydrogenase YdfG